MVCRCKYGAAHDDELYTFSDIEEGVVRVKDINTEKAFADITELTQVGDQLFFGADSRDYGHELWVTKGTLSSSKLVKDIDTVNHGHPLGLIAYKDKLYFSAIGWYMNYQMENLDFAGLWTSDGTEDGTYQIEDFVIPGEKSSPEIRKAIFQDRLYFFGYPKGAKDEGQFWQTSGGIIEAKLVDPFGAQGTGLVTNYLIEVNHQLFCTGHGGIKILNGLDDPLFSLDDQTGNDWRFLYNNGYQPKIMASSSKLYFVANQFAMPDHQTQIWVTDGTVEGTNLISNKPYFGRLNPWMPDINVKFHAAGDSFLFFSMDTEMDGKELWFSDGTTDGTLRLTGFNESNLLQNKVFGDAAYLNGNCFISISDQTNGAELWISDGTIEGTRLFVDLVEGAKGSEPHNLIVYNDKLYFFTEGDGVSNPLWESDGTVAGTKPIPWNYPRLVNFKEVLMWQDDLYFVASHPELGQGIFRYHFDGIAGISDMKSGTMDVGFIVYPNPVTDIISVAFDEKPLADVDAVILDIMGKEIRKTRISSYDFRITVGDLPTGIYFLQIGAKIQKFVKK